MPPHTLCGRPARSAIRIAKLLTPAVSRMAMMESNMVSRARPALTRQRSQATAQAFAVEARTIGIGSARMPLPPIHLTAFR